VGQRWDLGGRFFVMDSVDETLSTAATLRILQSIASDDSTLGSIGRFTPTGEPGGRIRPIASASALYEDGSDVPAELIDLRDTDLPIVSPDVNLDSIPAVSAWAWAPAERQAED
jgi:hypothetical protein